MRVGSTSEQARCSASTGIRARDQAEHERIPLRSEACAVDEGAGPLRSVPAEVTAAAPRQRPAGRTRRLLSHPSVVREKWQREGPEACSRRCLELSACSLEFRPRASASALAAGSFRPCVDDISCSPDEGAPFVLASFRIVLPPFNRGYRLSRISRMALCGRRPVETQDSVFRFHVEKKVSRLVPFRPPDTDAPWGRATSR